MTQGAENETDARAYTDRAIRRERWRRRIGNVVRAVRQWLTARWRAARAVPATVFACVAAVAGSWVATGFALNAASDAETSARSAVATATAANTKAAETEAATVAAVDEVRATAAATSADVAAVSNIVKEVAASSTTGSTELILIVERLDGHAAQLTELAERLTDTATPADLERVRVAVLAAAFEADTAQARVTDRKLGVVVQDLSVVNAELARLRAELERVNTGNGNNGNGNGNGNQP